MPVQFQTCGFMCGTFGGFTSFLAGFLSFGGLLTIWLPKKSSEWIQKHIRVILIEWKFELPVKSFRSTELEIRPKLEAREPIMIFSEGKNVLNVILNDYLQLINNIRTFRSISESILKSSMRAESAHLEGVAPRYILLHRLKSAEIAFSMMKSSLWHNRRKNDFKGTHYVKYRRAIFF